MLETSAFWPFISSLFKCKKHNFIKAEVLWAVKEEMARKVEDVLARRMRVLLLDARASIRMAPKVAKIMAEYLGHDQAWIDKEIEEFTQLANRYILK